MACEHSVHSQGVLNGSVGRGGPQGRTIRSFQLVEREREKKFHSTQGDTPHRRQNEQVSWYCTEIGPVACKAIGALRGIDADHRHYTRFVPNVD